MSKPKTQIRIICKICKKEFWIHNYRKTTAKYCSYKCQYESLKGCVSRFKGKKHSLKTRKYLSKVHKGQIAWCKGKKFSKKHKENLSISHIGIQEGSKHHNWKGGKFIRNEYMFIKNRIHPFCNNCGYVREQRLVAEQCLGRYLEPSERVHHINEIKIDNRPENLFVFENLREHNLFHNYLIKNPILKIFIESNLV